MVYQNEFLSYDSETNTVTVKDGVKTLYSQITMHELYNNYGDCTELKDEMNYVLVLPSCMEHIEDLSLSVMNMSEIVFPDSITYIGDSAFSNCTWLEKISWPSATKCIKHNTFYNCQALEEVDLPEGLLTICDNAFESCCSLTEVVIPRTVQEFGEDVFAKCDCLEIIKVPRSLFDKYNGETDYFRSDSGAEVRVYDEPMSTSTNTIEEPEIITEGTIKATSSSKKEIRCFNGRIRTNLIANKKNKS